MLWALLLSHSAQKKMKALNTYMAGPRLQEYIVEARCELMRKPCSQPVLAVYHCVTNYHSLAAYNSAYLLLHSFCG